MGKHISSAFGLVFAWRSGIEACLCYCGRRLPRRRGFSQTSMHSKLFQTSLAFCPIWRDLLLQLKLHLQARITTYARWWRAGVREIRHKRIHTY